MDSMLIATHASPVADKLAEAVPLLAPLDGTIYFSGLARVGAPEDRWRSSYKPKKSAVCLNLGRRSRGSVNLGRSQQILAHLVDQKARGAYIGTTT